MTDPIHRLPDIDEEELLSIRGYTPINQVDIVTGTCIVRFTQECIDTYKVYKYIDILTHKSIYLKKMVVR
jgi:hypothetical protein